MGGGEGGRDLHMDKTKGDVIRGGRSEWLGGTVGGQMQTSVLEEQ